jgi:hypothetical protein
MSWVHDRIFAAGGSQVPEDWRAFSDQTGIQAVVHLSPAGPMSFRGPAPQAFLWLGVDQEEQADPDTRRMAGEFVMACLEDGHSLLLHSAVGRHRTRWVFTAFLICSGVSLPQALGQAARPPWLAPYHTDQAAWELLVERLAHAPAER